MSVKQVDENVLSFDDCVFWGFIVRWIPIPLFVIFAFCDSEFYDEFGFVARIFMFLLGVAWFWIGRFFKNILATWPVIDQGEGSLLLPYPGAALSAMGYDGGKNGDIKRYGCKWEVIPLNQITGISARDKASLGKNAFGDAKVSVTHKITLSGNFGSRTLSMKSDDVYDTFVTTISNICGLS